MKLLSTNYNTSGFCVVNKFYEAQFTFTFTTLYTLRRIRTRIEGRNEDGWLYV